MKSWWFTYADMCKKEHKETFKYFYNILCTTTIKYKFKQFIKVTLNYKIYLT
jgi:hypothetical protein